MRVIDGVLHVGASSYPVANIASTSRAERSAMPWSKVIGAAILALGLILMSAALHMELIPRGQTATDPEAVHQQSVMIVVAYVLMAVGIGGAFTVFRLFDRPHTYLLMFTDAAGEQQVITSLTRPTLDALHAEILKAMKSPAPTHVDARSAHLHVHKDQLPPR
jgi:Co/Zn/Cd efflux system component